MLGTMTAFIISALLAFQVQASPPAVPPDNSGVPSVAAAPPAEQPPHSPLSAKEISELEAKAHGGDPIAQYKLAHAYSIGDGVPQDDQAAAEWNRKAADSGNSEAQNEMGIMYRAGQGVQKDEKQALIWYQKAARQGNADAMFNLGAAYYNGNGVGVNGSLSYAWFVLAKEAGSKGAVEAVQRSEAELKPGEITEGYKDIAEMYSGQLMPQNLAIAYYWLLQAANRGDADAEAEIGARLALGKGAAPEPAEGWLWCSRSAKVFDIRGENCMGYLYRHGLGVKRDPRQARKWYERTAAKGDALGIRSLADMDVLGEGAKVDRSAACILYLELVGTGDQDILQLVVHLREQMSSHEWNAVEKQLPRLGIAPSTLNAWLNQAGPPQKK